MARRLLTLFIVSLVLFAVVPSTSGQTVVSRTRVGNLPEGSTYVSTGALAGNIVVLDGYDVFAFPPEKPPKGSTGGTKAFNLKALPILGHPNGVAYIPQDKTFVFTEGISPDKLFLSDSNGKLVRTITITYLDGWMPSHVEGIAYIPPTSPIYSDHFVTAAVELAAPNHHHLEVINRDGQVVADIHPEPLPPDLDWDGNFLGGVEFLPGGTLLCGLNNNLVEYDFNGSLLRVVPFDTGFFEGITRLPGGSFVALGYQPGILTFLDRGLGRTPQLDRSYLFPPGLTGFPGGIAWKSDAKQYLLRLNFAPVTGIFDQGIWALPESLSTVAKLFGFPAGPGFPNPNQYRQMVYIPEEHLLAILYRQDGSEGRPPHPDIHLFDSYGNLVDIIHIADVVYNNRGNIPGQLTYVPSLGQFVIRQNNANGTPTPYALFIWRNTGEVMRQVDLTAAGMATGFGVVTYFNDGTDKLLFLANSRRMVVTGLGGVLLQEFDPRTTLGILSPTVTSIGPNAGTFATHDGGEFILYSLTAQKTKKK